MTLDRRRERPVPPERLLHRDGHEFPSNEVYDADRFAAALTHIGPVAPSAMVSEVVAELDHFAGGHEPGGDQTLLVPGLG